MMNNKKYNLDQLHGAWGAGVYYGKKNNKQSIGLYTNLKGKYFVWKSIIQERIAFCIGEVIIADIDNIFIRLYPESFLRCDNLKLLKVMPIREEIIERLWPTSSIKIEHQNDSLFFYNSFMEAIEKILILGIEYSTNIFGLSYDAWENCKSDNINYIKQLFRQ